MGSCARHRDPHRARPRRNDCAVCVLAMYLGVSYEDVLRVVAVRDRPWQGRQGLRLHEVEHIAASWARAEAPAQVRPAGGLRHALAAAPPGAAARRPDRRPEVGGATLWEVEDYLHTYHCRPGVLLVARGEEAGPLATAPA